jgi:propanol-preferring alcohol dehydrogenase
MSKFMYAYRLTEWGQAPTLQEIEVPTPAPGQLLVKVAGNGLCQSDLHMPHLNGAMMEPMGWQVPFTLGHEIGGWVEDWGEGVSGFDKGEAVALVASTSCGKCLECEAGFDNVCDHNAVNRGAGRDGGLADYVLVESARPLVKLGDMEPLTAGPLTDAGSTSYHAFNRIRPKLMSGSNALVIGAGGLGSFAIQYLKVLTSCNVIVADINPQILARAKRLGADACINTRETDLATEVSKLTGGGAIGVLDFVGTDETVVAGVACLAKRGSYVLIGGAGGGHSDSLFSALSLKSADIYSFMGPTLRDTQEVFELARQGVIENPVELFEFNDNDIQDAYLKLANGELNGRAVVKVAK